MNSLTQSTLLQTLGDDWHNTRVYDSLILSVAPETKYLDEIASALLSIYSDEKNNFKTCTTIPSRSQTLFGIEVSRNEVRLKSLQEDMKKEEKNLDSLTVTFAGLEGAVPAGTFDSDSDDDDEDDNNPPKEKEKGKGNGFQLNIPVKKMSHLEMTKIKELKRKIRLLKSTKTAMASSQQKLFDLQKEISLTETKITYYNHYCHADFGYLCGINKLVLAYEKTKDINDLIKGLDSLISYYEMIRRRYVPSAHCSGKYKDICDTHLLHLSTPVYSSKGDVIHARCPIAVL